MRIKPDGYIADFDLRLRGWGFPAERCDPEDEDAVCRAEEGGFWLKPMDPNGFHRWCIAGKPRDEANLRRYGAVNEEWKP